MPDASNGHNCVEADYKKGGEMAMGGLGGGGKNLFSKITIVFRQLMIKKMFVAYIWGDLFCNDLTNFVDLSCYISCI